MTRWASVAFGAGVGLGSAYTDCSHIMVGALPKWPLPSNIPPNSHAGPEVCTTIFSTNTLGITLQPKI